MPVADGYDGFYMRCPVVVVNQFIQFIQFVEFIKFVRFHLVVLHEFIEFLQFFVGLSVRLSRRSDLPS